MIRIRLTVLILGIAGVLLGIGIGFLVFQTVIDRDTRLATVSKAVGNIFRIDVPIVKYSGTVLRHDEEKNILVLNIPSSFSISASSTIPVMLQYTPETKWMSIEYVFRDGVMEKRHWSNEESRQLPRDALVSIVQYYDGIQWRSVAIAYLRKTNI